MPPSTRSSASSTTPEPVTDLLLQVLPAANRVYAASGPAMATAEVAALAALAPAASLGPPAPDELAGVAYVRVPVPDPPGAEALALLGAVSLGHACFAPAGDGLLRPVALARPDRLDASLHSIPRYAGRTNESFTRLLVNLAGAAAGGAAAFGPDARLRLLDPVCGRGTTLHVALAHGWDATGIELDRRDVEAWRTFFPGWLRDQRLPHVETKGLPRNRTRITFALDRAAQRAGIEQVVEVVAGDTVDAPALLPGARFDCLVADLPYGVRHGSRRGDALDRGPAALLAAALPGWRALLRPGGPAILAWNRHVLDRPAMVGLLDATGFEPVVLPDGDDAFVHRVDRSVLRDVVVARRPS